MVKPDSVAVRRSVSTGKVAGRAGAGALNRLARACEGEDGGACGSGPSARPKTAAPPASAHDRATASMKRSPPSRTMRSTTTRRRPDSCRLSAITAVRAPPRLRRAVGTRRPLALDMRSSDATSRAVAVTIATAPRAIVDQLNHMGTPGSLRQGGGQGREARPRVREAGARAEERALRPRPVADEE